MLNRFDDYPIHQTPEPLGHPSSGDRNFYDRYFLNGFTRSGDAFFAAALGLYPNRRVMDAAVSVVHDGTQHVVRASRLAPLDRGETRVGPISIEIREPMRSLVLRVDPNDFGLEAELEFRARTAAVEEPRFTYRSDGRTWFDATRFTQFGGVEGWLDVAGARISLDAGDTCATRDRSWGVRPVGEREAAAPGPPPQFFWLWAPLQFDDLCTHFAVNEDAEGRAWHASGCVVGLAKSEPELEPWCESTIERMRSVAHRVQWAPGTRRVQRASLTLEPWRAEPHVVELEPILTFQMLGLGYTHPEWGHGMWKGELAVDGESWSLAELDPMDLRHIHVQQLCRARMGAREGMGVLEQLVIGPHAPSGFRGLLDPAS
ncbi:MAG: hypothetical protein JSU66_09825 [Deltaproteobacteria bacterium]|nr:MAG: hypothetical protein JSU66_09825 [Deltaproteobacteria bacterium]